MNDPHQPESGRGRRGTVSAVLATSVALVAGSVSLASAQDVQPVSEEAPSTQQVARPMEDLGRGVVAVRSSENEVLVSWRLLGLDSEGLGFHVERATGGGDWERLTNEPLTGGTNFVDDSADLAQDNAYRVVPIDGGTEQDPSGEFTLTADHAVEPVVRLPLREGGPIKFVWVGDLDGDGEYDYVLDRQTAQQSLEAYSSDGEFLWEVDMGPNSENQDNIEPSSSTIDVGHNDGVTVYDFDSDGDSEVAVRVGDGVTFGDGSTHSEDDNIRQSIAILDGATGSPLATAPVPDDYVDDGPLAARFGVAYLEADTPSLVSFMKNRIGGGEFNLVIGAWTFDGTDLSQKWLWHRDGLEVDYPTGHNTRAVDLDGNGTDEVAEIGFVLNSDGTMRYNLADQGVLHGDRWHIADMDPSRPGLEGYAVQQNNPSGLREYYYDADTGAMIWQHVEDGTADVGRGMAADIDPYHPGMEVWSFSGLYNAPSNELTEFDTELSPWPHHGLWWDGDLTRELLNDDKFEKWDPENPTPSNSLPRILNVSTYGAVDTGTVNPAFVGDIFGDWREEAVYPNAAYDEMIIFSTNQPTEHRIYTLAHNPAYRNGMTFKGYMQSSHPDYFLGHGMEEPPRPNIVYSGS